MVRKIQRKSDKKFLSSVENETWVNNIKDAYELTLNESKEVFEQLEVKYPNEQFIQYTNAWKNKAS